uniref:UreK protein n=1 Tax=Rhodobacter capsulatus TaxID=1061 RepID=Q9AQT3_RHOCA|nr:ureK [Rhodobacter capsulatus]
MRLLTGKKPCAQGRAGIGRGRIGAVGRLRGALAGGPQHAGHLFPGIGGVKPDFLGQKPRIEDALAAGHQIDGVKPADLRHRRVAQQNLAQGALARAQAGDFGTDFGQFIGWGFELHPSLPFWVSSLPCCQVTFKKL